MKIIYAGDVHGSIEAMTHLDDLATEIGARAVVQCGDFGIYWPFTKGKVIQHFARRAKKGRHVPWYFCDGNHDVHDKLDSEHVKGRLGTVVVNEGNLSEGLVEIVPGLTHVRRGGFVTLGGVKHVFCGGARSTDRGPGSEMYEGKRIWWPQEAPSREDLEKFHSSLEAVKPDVVITHEAPLVVPVWRVERESDPTSRGFETIYRLVDHKPKYWFFGHHHILEKWTDGDTTFACTGINGTAWIRDCTTGEVVPSVRQRPKDISFGALVAK